MNGVCTRWVVVMKRDGAPVDGTMYFRKEKADKRLAAYPNPEKFAVAEIALMPVVLAHKLIAALPLVVEADSALAIAEAV